MIETRKQHFKSDIYLAIPYKKAVLYFKLCRLGKKDRIKMELKRDIDRLQQDKLELTTAILKLKNRGIKINKTIRKLKNYLVEIPTSPDPKWTECYRCGQITMFRTIPPKYCSRCTCMLLKIHEHIGGCILRDKEPYRCYSKCIHHNKCNIRNYPV
jgi:hypothetical protein